METCSKFHIKEPVAAKNAKAKEGKMLKNVRHAKVKVESCKCIKWAQECISKFKRIAINVKAKAKLLVKGENARPARARKYWKKKKLLKLQLIKVHQTIIPLKCQDKEIKYLMHWQVI